MFFQKIKHKIRQGWGKIGPEKGVIIFIITLLISNGLWKLCIDGDDYNPEVLFLGKWDISNAFDWAILSTTSASYWILNLFGFEALQPQATCICYPNGNCISIIWGCTAIKQSFIFLCIMITARGSFSQKAWFIPCGIFVIYIFNILRITIIAAFVKTHPEWFEFLHGILMKYIFYTFIFLIWVFWEEKIRKQ